LKWLSEILGLRFDEIDFDRPEIRLPYWRTKERTDKNIPLKSIVLSLLKIVKADREVA
jgi:integrase